MIGLLIPPHLVRDRNNSWLFLKDTLAKRSILTARDAELIANKLHADVDESRTNHAIAIIRLNGKEVGRFGIRRGSGELGHDHIPRQIHVAMKQAIQLARCKIYDSDYENILRVNGYYPG